MFGSRFRKYVIFPYSALIHPETKAPGHRLAQRMKVNEMSALIRVRLQNFYVAGRLAHLLWLEV